MALGEALSVIIGADADPLVKELNKAQREVQKWGREVQENLREISEKAEVLGELLGVAVGGGVLELTRRTLENVGALGEQAEMLGMNVERMQALSFAAGQAGVDHETFRTGLMKLSKLLGEAASGEDTAIKTFKKWAIATRDASGNIRSLDEVLDSAADRIQSIHDPALRAAAAFELFGRDGQRLLNFLSQGSEGLGEMEKRARDMGAVIGEDLVVKAREASDQLRALGDVISAHLSSAIISVLPSAERLNYWLERFSVNSGLKSIADSDNIELLEDRIKSYQEKLQRLKSTSFGAWVGQSEIKNLSDTIDALTIKVQALKEKNSLLTKPEHSETKGKGFVPSIGKKDDATEALSDFIDKLNQEHESLQLTGDARARYNALVQAETIARKNNIKLTQQQIDEIGYLATANSQLEESQKKANEKAQELKQFSNQLASSFSSTFENAITSGKGLGSVLSGLATDVQKLILRFAVLKPLTDSLSGYFGGGGFMDGVAGFLGTRAVGGSVAGGQPYLVGERGPELFVPSFSGNIVPNNQLSGGGGSSRGQNNNFNFSISVNGGGASNQKQAAEVGSAIGQAVKAQILDILAEQQRAGGMLYR